MSSESRPSSLTISLRPLVDQPVTSQAYDIIPAVYTALQHRCSQREDGGLSRAGGRRGTSSESRGGSSKVNISHGGRVAVKRDGGLQGVSVSGSLVPYKKHAASSIPSSSSLSSLHLAQDRNYQADRDDSQPAQASYFAGQAYIFKTILRTSSLASLLPVKFRILPRISLQLVLPGGTIPDSDSIITCL